MIKEEERWARHRPQAACPANLPAPFTACWFATRVPVPVHSMLNESNSEVQKQQTIERKNLKNVSKKDKVRG
jgi:hypothetical protein